MGELTHTIFVMKGSIPGQFIVSNEVLYYVYREVWEGHKLITTHMHGAYADKRDAQIEAEKIRKAYDA